MARDGAFPYSEWLRKINPTTKSPINMILLILCIDFVLLLIPLGSPLAFAAITSISTVGEYYNPLLHSSYWTLLELSFLTLTHTLTPLSTTHIRLSSLLSSYDWPSLSFQTLTHALTPFPTFTNITIGYQVSYAIPIILRLTTGMFEQGEHFNLGKYSRPMHFISAVFLVVTGT